MIQSRVRMWASLTLGAIGAVAFLFRAFRVNGTPPMLMGLMTAWVLAPFGVLVAAAVRSARWSTRARAVASHTVTLTSIATVGAYALNAFRPLSSKAAAIYVVVPPASLVLVAVGAIIASTRRGR